MFWWQQDKDDYKEIRSYAIVLQRRHLSTQQASASEGAPKKGNVFMCGSL